MSAAIFHNGGTLRSQGLTLGEAEGHFLSRILRERTVVLNVRGPLTECRCGGGCGRNRAQSTRRRRRHDLDDAVGEQRWTSQGIAGQVAIHGKRQDAIWRGSTTAAFGHLLVGIEYIDVRTEVSPRKARVDDAYRAIRISGRVGI